jgi:hypothetical protein
MKAPTSISTSVSWGITFSFPFKDHDSWSGAAWETGERINSDPDEKGGLVRIAHDRASLGQVGNFPGEPRVCLAACKAVP